MFIPEANRLSTLLGSVRPQLLKATSGQWFGFEPIPDGDIFETGSHVELNSPPCWHTRYFLFPFIILLLDSIHVVGAKL